MPPPLTITPAAARRFMRRALLLDAPAPDLATALAHHGYIQIDPINICGRMHDLILRNRVAGYREGDLHRHAHSAARPAYEHYLPGSTSVLVAYPIAAWPMLAARIRTRRLRGDRFGRPLPPTHERLARRILDEIAARGPLTSDSIEHDGRSRTGWGTPGRLVKNILEILLVHGRVLISARRHFRRVYDLPERVLPAAVLAAPDASEADTARWLALTTLRQRRLVLLKKRDFPLVEDLVQPIHVDGCPTLHCLREDLPLLLEIKNRESSPGDGRDEHRAGSSQQRCISPLSTLTSPLSTSSAPHLLAPLDPLIYDRRVTSALWNYDYTWEAYTPPAKRRRGYYALPVLAGTEIVGHVDPKADRERRKLIVVSRALRRGHRAASAVTQLARFLGLK